MIDIYSYDMVPLSDFLAEYKELNANNRFRPVAVGRYGIRTRESIYSKELAQDYSKNKLIYKDTLTVGMGSVQMDIGILTDDIIYSVSPAYHTYRINGINCDYLRFCLQARNADMFERYKKRGSRQGKSIDLKAWLHYLIPVYEIDGQLQIVSTLHKIQSIIDDRMQQLQKLDDLVKARFVEMFGNPIENPMQWDTYSLKECLERIDNGKSFICSDKPRTGDNPAILKLSAATYGDYRSNENKALLDESLFVESSEVHAGDLLFTRKNTPELVGMAAYVLNTPPKLMMPDLIFRLVPNEKVNAVFLWLLINCKEFRPAIQAISGGSAKSMSNISKERLGKIKIICPPRELQDFLIPFVKQVDKSKFVESIHVLKLIKEAIAKEVSHDRIR